jgi:hypothetical protein
MYKLIQIKIQKQKLFDLQKIMGLIVAYKT